MFSEIDIGSRSALALADLNGDGEKEMVLGNSRGGLSYYAFVPPQADFSVWGACLGQTIGFANHSISGNTYQWYFSDTSTNWIDSSTIQHPNIIFTDSEPTNK